MIVPFIWSICDSSNGSYVSCRIVSKRPKSNRVATAIAAELLRYQDQIDTMSNLTSVEVRVSFENKNDRTKVQISLHTARLTSS